MYSYNLTPSNLHYEKFQDGSVKQVDVPFEIPESWEWVKLNNIIKLTSGRDLPKEKYSDTENKTYPYITGASNFSNLKIMTNRYTDDNSVLSYRGDILITVKGTIGELAFNPFKAAYIARQVMAISGIQIYSDYLFFYLQNSISILKNKGQSLIPGISRDTILDLFIPIPPLKEQKRIVEILFKAIPKFEKYSCCYYELKKLNSDFPEKLRKSILQYAMQGKLVPQDSTDEPVEVLLEKIREEKQRLFEKGKLQKKDLQESIIYQDDDNSYYEKQEKQLVEIPKSWKWVKLTTIAFITMGQSPKSKDVFSQKIVDSIEFHQGKSFFGKFNLNESKTYTTNSNKMINKPSVLLSVRAPVGDVNYVNRPVVIGRGLAAITCYKGISLSYLFNYLSTQKINLESMATGSTFKAINSHIINNILVPLPSTMEQKRIVNKTEKILVLISKL